ncbi:MAG: hypothetical protein J7501_10355 [Bdellovibrio sp.]|nr:hypothetical protein [Bdellovibrio sp.]
MKIGTFILPLLFSFSTAVASEATIMWAGGEHLELGEQGALSACREMGITDNLCPSRTIHREDKKIIFSYGEIVTSADFYDTPAEMYADRRKGVKNVIKCAHKQQHNNEEEQQTGKEKETHCDLKSFLSMPTYLEVVSKNYAHFGWHNMVAYVKYHQIALDKAAKAFALRKKSPQESYELFNQALVTNAFADHYLTDAFASGHIRVPRTQIKDWAEANLSGLLKKNRGNLLTMVMHDRESIGLRSQKEEGLPVMNSLGESWITRADSHLHVLNGPQDEARIRPERAVQTSVKEILTAYLTGEVPTGIFKATELVPFNQDIPLIEKFSPRYQGMTKKELVNAFFGDEHIYERIIHRRSDLSQMLDALPQIFVTFRKEVSQAISKNPELSRRLPARYLEAYQKVN